MPAGADGTAALASMVNTAVAATAMAAVDTASATRSRLLLRDAIGDTPFRRGVRRRESALTPHFTPVTAVCQYRQSTIARCYRPAIDGLLQRGPGGRRDQVEAARQRHPRHRQDRQIGHVSEQPHA